MKTIRLLAIGLLAWALCGAALAASGTVLRVIVVKTDNVSGYVAEIEKARTMMKRLGVNVTTRVWQATFAGPNAGAIVVSQEFPSFAAVAETQAKTTADPEFSTWLKSLDKIRTVQSDSLYREL